MQKYGFVYIWRDKKNGRYYVGSHWGTTEDGYVCSSRWMRNAHKRRPTDFKRRIVYKTEDRTILLDEEGRWLQMIKREELGKRYYNLNFTTKPGHWSSDERSRLTVGQKIASAPGRSEKISKANAGKTHSKETREKLRAANLGKKSSPETSAKRSASLRKAWETRSRTFGPEARENMRLGHLGKKLSPEHLAARIKGQTGVKRGQYKKAANG